MCLLFFSYRMTPGYRLVVAANRDEFLNRPTAPLDFADDDKTMLSGRDLQNGGTWLGITAGMRFAAITNYRAPAANKVAAPSRGEILMKYLTGGNGAGQFLNYLVDRASSYSGFNLVIGDDRELFYYSNQTSGPEMLAPGFYGLSNHLLDTPWPKVVRGKKLLRPHMVDTDRVNPLKILDVLTDRHCPPDDRLPATGVGLLWERLLSPIFIDGESYGTRSSAVITVTEEGKVEFTERTFQRSSAGEIHRLLVRRTLNG